MIFDAFENRFSIGSELTPNVILAFHALLQDSGVLESYSRALEYEDQRLNDSAP